MNDQHYATPNSDIQPNNTDVSGLLAPLENTKLWVRICSIVGFISTAFMVLAAIGIMAAGSQVTAGMPFGAGIGILYLVLAAIYFFASWYLHKYAGAISQAQESQSMTDISNALNYQKSFWKLVGILALIMIVFMIIGMGAAIVIPMMAMS